MWEALVLRHHCPLWEFSHQSQLVILIHTLRLTLPSRTTRWCPKAVPTRNPGPGPWCTPHHRHSHSSDNLIEDGIITTCNFSYPLHSARNLSLYQLSYHFSSDKVSHSSHFQCPETKWMSSQKEKGNDYDITGEHKWNRRFCNIFNYFNLRINNVFYRNMWFLQSVAWLDMVYSQLTTYTIKQWKFIFILQKFLTESVKLLFTQMTNQYKHISNKHYVIWCTN